MNAVIAVAMMAIMMLFLHERHHQDPPPPPDRVESRGPLRPSSDNGERQSRTSQPGGGSEVHDTHPDDGGSPDTAER